jgi:hypothetical protein
VIFFSFVPQHICRRLRKLFEVCRLAKPSYFINCGLINVLRRLIYTYLMLYRPLNNGLKLLLILFNQLEHL